MGVLHSPAAFLVPIFPNAHAECRSRTRDRVASRVIVLALRYGQGGILLAELLYRRLRAQIGDGSANLGKVEGVLRRGQQAASLATDAATPTLLVGRPADILAGRGAAISTALLAEGSVIRGRLDRGGRSGTRVRTRLGRARLVRLGIDLRFSAGRVRVAAKHSIQQTSSRRGETATLAACQFVKVTKVWGKRGSIDEEKMGGFRCLDVSGRVIVSAVGIEGTMCDETQY